MFADRLMKLVKHPVIVTGYQGRKLTVHSSFYGCIKTLPSNTGVDAHGYMLAISS